MLLFGENICILLCMNKPTGKGMMVFKIILWCKASALILFFFRSNTSKGKDIPSAFFLHCHEVARIFISGMLIIHLNLSIAIFPHLFSICKCFAYSNEKMLLIRQDHCYYASCQIDCDVIQ